MEKFEKLLSSAKFDPNNFLPFVQEIRFDDNFPNNAFKLMQGDSSFVESCKSKERLSFKGHHDDFAFACSEQKTYEVKQAETSNSLLLLEGDLMPPEATTEETFAEKSCKLEGKKVLEIAHSCLEMKETIPMMNAIRNKLQSSIYRGPEAEKELEKQPDRVFYSVDTLVQSVAASSLQVAQFLSKVPYLIDNGFIRLIEDDYLFHIFSLVQNFVEENSWPINGIDKSLMVESLSELAPSIVLEKVVEWFLLPVSSSNSEEQDIEGLDLFQYNEKRVSKFLGMMLLKSVKQKGYKEFVSAWQSCLPDGISVDIELLKDCAVIDDLSAPPVVTYFPEYHLPTTQVERFDVLYTVKDKWTLNELTPFLEGVIPQNQSVGNVVNKFSRPVIVKGVKYYTAKHKR